MFYPLIGFGIIGILLIIWGIIRYNRGSRVEGTTEIVAGVFEIIFEVIGAML